MKAAYVVDTPILLDILENDPEYGASSAALLDRYSDASLLISLISYFELAPAFDGKRSLQDEFLGQIGVVLSHQNVRETGPLVYRAWARYYRRVQALGGQEFQFVPCLLGTLACCYDGIITRRGAIYRAIFPDLNVITE